MFFTSFTQMHVNKNFFMLTYTLCRIPLPITCYILQDFFRDKFELARSIYVYDMFPNGIFIIGKTKVTEKILHGYQKGIERKRKTMVKWQKSTSWSDNWFHVISDERTYIHTERLADRQVEVGRFAVKKGFSIQMGKGSPFPVKQCFYVLNFSCPFTFRLPPTTTLYSFQFLTRAGVEPVVDAPRWQLQSW